GGEAHRALDTRIDRVAEAHNVPEHHLGNGGDRSVLEIEFVAFATCRALGSRRHCLRLAATVAIEARGLGALASRPTHLTTLGEARQKIDGAHPIDDVAWTFWTGRDHAACGDACRGDDRGNADHAANRADTAQRPTHSTDVPSLLKFVSLMASAWSAAA